MPVSCQQIACLGWPHCYRLANDKIELIITSDVGPRVIHFSSVGGPNLFYQVSDELGQTGGEHYRIYGGHRLWVAPEHKTHTYRPDNAPVEVDFDGHRLQLTAPVEAQTGIQKVLELDLGADGCSVSVVHRLINHSHRAIQLAPWAITVMVPGGYGILPLPAGGAHADNLLPTASLALWAYTDLADARLEFGRDFILIQQAREPGQPLKLGLSPQTDWLAYVHAGNVFVKTFAVDAESVYPDRNCCAEIFTNPDMLELESLGPLSTLEPGRQLEHEECWFLLTAMPDASGSDAFCERILPAITALLAKNPY